MPVSVICKFHVQILLGRQSVAKGKKEEVASNIEIFLIFKIRVTFVICLFFCAVETLFMEAVMIRNFVFCPLAFYCEQGTTLIHVLVTLLCITVMKCKYIVTIRSSSSYIISSSLTSSCLHPDLQLDLANYHMLTFSTILYFLTYK